MYQKHSEGFEEKKNSVCQNSNFEYKFELRRISASKSMPRLIYVSLAEADWWSHFTELGKEILREAD